jgi:hypothetical protein
MDTAKLPVEMSDAVLREHFPQLGSGCQQMPLEKLYPLLTRLEKAMIDGAGGAYNPDSLTIHDFRWANVLYMGIEQLVSESVATGKTHAGDTKLIPNPENKFQGYMYELTKLAKP